MDSVYYPFQQTLGQPLGMKISELSQASQVPVPTIKFYIREGLLPAGQRTARNQAEYGSMHLSRLALIRALQDAVGMPLETIARALRAADTAEQQFVIAAIDALEPPPQTNLDTHSAAYTVAERALLALIKRRGWKLKTDDLCVRNAIRALTHVGQHFTTMEDDDLDPYADAVELMAQHEVPDDWQPDASRDDALHYAVLGTVLFEPFILALRRMAHVSRTRTLEKKPTRKQR